jgi:sec-independent protein translocase protein TatC
MVMFILSKMGFVKVKTWRSKRKIAYFVISIAAAVMAASPDLFSMMSLMVPLMMLYEIGIIAAAIGARGQPKQEEPQEPEQTA